MTDNQQAERRRFSRIPFQADAHLYTDNGELFLRCPVNDISLNGLLIDRPFDWQQALDSTVDVDLVLAGAQIVIKMHCQVAHIDQQSVGLRCEQLDLDSMTHLKQLVSLNLGNSTILEREFSALITS